MRVSVTPERVELIAGAPQPVVLTISNDQDIIAGYTIRVLGADPGWVQLPQNTVSLFPDETRVVTLTLQPPGGMPAGTRRLALQVRETTPPHASVITELDLVVPEEPGSRIQVDPTVVTAGKRGSFSLLLENTGNTRLTGWLVGDDPEGRVRFGFDPERVVLPPGHHTVVDMTVSAKRAKFGTPTVRSLTIDLDAERPDEFFEGPRPSPADDGEAAERPPMAHATFIQKAVFARGALSLFGLMLAATVFAVVITVALSRLVAQSTADRNLALQVAAARDSGAGGGGTSGLGGTVRLLTSGAPVRDVTVSVFSADDTSKAVATTATDTAGRYAVSGLAAGSYKISYQGAGFVGLWYPGAASSAEATAVQLQAGQTRAGLNATLGGVPASIKGTVRGDDVGAATLFLETRPTGGAAPAAVPGAAPVTPSSPGTVAPPDTGGAVVQQVPIGSDGSFALTGVPSPSVYDLVVVKQGYATTIQAIDLGAGETRQGVQLTLLKGDGQISGTVVGPSGPLSGVSITATSGQTTASTVSLTGSGTFTLRNLTTPASYTIIASAGGYGSQTLAVSLAAGQKLGGLSVTMARTSGTVHGAVSVQGGGSPSGVGVTLTDGRITVPTVTGADGSWTVAGLPMPGTYTATFARADLQSQTVSVGLSASGTVTSNSLGAGTGPLRITMISATVAVHGTVTQTGGATTCDGSKLGEATVTMTSGASSWTVTTASVDPHCGQYRIEQLPPGTYTVTVSAGSGTTPESRVVTLVTGRTPPPIDIDLSSPASLVGTVVDASGAPKTGWTVFLYTRAGYPALVQSTTLTAAGDGSFAFAGLQAGAYIVSAGPTSDPSNAVVTKTVNVQPSSTTTVTIKVPR